MKMRETSRGKDKKPCVNNYLTWANQIRVLKQQFEILGSTIGGVLINAFKPLVITLNNVMGKVISFAKTIADALGQIFGWTFEVNPGGIADDGFEDMSAGVEDVADSAGDASKAIKDTTKKAKELKENLQGFDRLNVISIDKDTDNGSSPSSGSGSGSSGSGLSGVGGGLNTSLVKTDSILKPYESEIDSLYKLGKYIGDALSKAMESIDWDKVYAKARNFGTGLADFLNGLISPELFSAVGKTIAGALNTALNVLDSFGERYDWTNLGNSIKAGLVSFLNGIDWKTALSAASNWGIGIAKALNAFISPDAFGRIGKSVAKAINVALQFLNDFGTTFSWNKFGKSLGTSLNAFLKTLNWKSYLKGAKTYGTGIANAINSFLSETDFKKVGSSVAQFLNGAIVFALSSGKTLKFDVIGKKIADGINGFFKKLKVKDLAETINTWVKGALKTVSTLLKKTDFEMIGRKIGQFLAELDFLDIMAKLAGAIWAAIKGAFSVLTGMISEAPLETALIAAFAAFKFLGVGSLISSSISKAIMKYLAEKLSVDLAAETSISSVLSSGLSTRIAPALRMVQDKLNALIPIVGTVATSFLDFNLARDAFKTMTEKIEDATMGVGDFIKVIGEIAGAVGLAAGAFALFGPAGAAVTAIAGLIGAVKGINDALDEIDTELVSQSIHDALANPGGVSIYELSDMVAESIGKIGGEFSNLSEKSNELDNADKNIDDIISRIQLVEEQLKTGTITAEDAADQFNSLLSELQTAVSTKIGAINQYMLGAFGKGGAWGQAWEQAGYDASEMVGKTLGLTSEMQTEFDRLIKKLSKTDPTSPKWAELQTQLYGVIGETDSLEQAINSFDYKISTLDIDYSNLATEEGELNEREVEDAMEGISSAVNDANKEIDAAGEELSTTFQEMIDSARSVGDEETAKYLEDALAKLPQVISVQKEQIAKQAEDMTDIMQSRLVDNVKKMTQDAEKEWNSLTDTEKKATGTSSAVAYANKKINDYVNNVINPFSQAIEKEMGQLGIDGAGWSEKAGQDIIDGIYDYNYNSPNKADTQNGMMKDWEGIIDSVASNASGYVKKQFESVGRDAVGGFANADAHDARIFGGKVGDESVDGTRKSLDSNSPSKVYKSIGKDVVDGFLIGLKNNWKSVKTWWKNNAKLPEIKASIEDLKKRVAKEWKNVTNYWKKKELEISAKFTTKEKDIKSWWISIKSWWGDKKLEVKNDFKTTSDNTENWWTKLKNWWGDKRLEVSNSFETTSNNVSKWWEKIKKWWGTKKLEVYNLFKTKRPEVNSWWKDKVKTWWGTRELAVKTKYTTAESTVNSWGKKTVRWLKAGISAAWSDFSTWFTNKMKSLMNGAIRGMNWVLKGVGSSTRIDPWPGYAKGTGGLKDDTVGIVNDQKGSTYRELIVPPHGKPYVPEGRNVALAMQKGTKILPADETKRLLNIFPKFEKGTIGFSGEVLDYLEKPKEILKIGMDKHVDLSGVTRPTLQLSQSALNMFANEATAFFKKIFATVVPPGIEGAMRWMVNIANDPAHGYDQDRRTGPDYDCSSLITSALTRSGIPVGVLDTSRMLGALTSHGFKDVVNSVNASTQAGMKRGDILLVPAHHTAAYLGKGQIVHARINELGKTTGGKTGDQTGREIMVGSYYNYPWKHILRYGGKFANGIGKINTSDIIKGYASGGFPKSGQLFLARENGATELVGKLGNQTAVANNQQITKAFTNAVKDVMEDSFSDFSKKITQVVDASKESTKAITESAKEYAKIGGESVNALSGVASTILKGIAGKTAENNNVSKIDNATKKAAIQESSKIWDTKANVSIDLTDESENSMEEEGGEIIDSLTAGMQEHMEGLNKYLSTMRSAVSNFISGVPDDYGRIGSETILNYEEGLQSMEGSLLDYADDLADDVENSYDMEDEVYIDGNRIIVGLQEGMSESFEELQEWVQQAKDSIIENFYSIEENMIEIGKNIISSLIEGIQSMWEEVEEWAKKISDTFTSVSETASSIKNIGENTSKSTKASTKAKTATNKAKKISNYKEADTVTAKKWNTGGKEFNTGQSYGEDAGTQVIQSVSAGVADAVNKIVVPAMGQLGNVTVKMIGDSSKFFRAVVDQNNQELIRTGRYGLQKG